MDVRLRDSNDCLWSMLDHYHRSWLGALLIFFGLLGAAANGWLMSTILMSPKLTSRTMLILLSLSIGCVGRSVLSGFPFAATSVLAGRWLFGDACCQMFAFLRQLFGVSQMASLTLLAVETLVLSRHPQLGSRISLSLYAWSVGGCWLASAVWSLPPLIGVGRYGCDVTGLACEIDWRRTTHQYHLGFNFSLLLIGYVLPTFVTCVCIWRSLTSDKHHMALNQDGSIQVDQRSLNKTALALVTGLYIMWLPQATLAMWSLHGEVTDDLEDRRVGVPIALAVLAPLSAEVSALVPVIACLACDRKLRRALLGMIGKSPKIRRNRRRRGVRFTGIK